MRKIMRLMSLLEDFIDRDSLWLTVNAVKLLRSIVIAMS
jgi:hypothetical protein